MPVFALNSVLTITLFFATDHEHGRIIEHGVAAEHGFDNRRTTGTISSIHLKVSEEEKEEVLQKMNDRVEMSVSLSTGKEI